jgi:DNA-binding transcriptional ArsR family regulator
MTYRTGSINEFMKWTKQVVKDPAAAKDAPKRWFDSDETARSVLQDEVEAGLQDDVSAEAMVKLLSPENLAMLHVISQQKPESMRRLAELTGREESNLSRTLKKLERAGLVGFMPGPGRTRVPRVIARKVRLEIDLTGQGSAVAVEA